jgi:hypothetical protein
VRSRCGGGLVGQVLNTVAKLGHPPSYGLLAAKLASTIAFDLAEALPALDVPNDRASAGLDAEYRAAVERACEVAGVPVQITAAMQGEAGSSPALFFALATMLVE